MSASILGALKIEQSKEPIRCRGFASFWEWRLLRRGPCERAIAPRRPLRLNLNSLGDSKTESTQLITANESLFERAGRGVH